MSDETKVGSTDELLQELAMGAVLEWHSGKDGGYYLRGSFKKVRCDPRAVQEYLKPYDSGRVPPWYVKSQETITDEGVHLLKTFGYLV